jgi:pimeloyl-ACP methyl ester carboxylesterase
MKGNYPMQTLFMARLRSRFARTLLLAGSVLLLLSVFSAGYDAYASRRALAEYAPPGQFVRVGAARMHYMCQGAGEPTLVLEAGFGGGALDWSPVMPALAARHRVCAFDRLGQDWSDPAPHPRTFGTGADELHVALEQIGVVRPIVVGHSLGGALVQIYAARYPTAGVILVDGLTSDVVEPVVGLRGKLHLLGPLGWAGLLRPIGAMTVDSDYSPGLRAEMIALRSRSAALINTADEGAVAAASAGAELRAAEVGLRSPLLLIAAGRTDVPGLRAGAFQAALKALAERKPGAAYVLIPDATHYVQANHPQAVIDAIESWIPTTQSSSE